MELNKLAERVVQICDESDNNYDAKDEVLKLLDLHYPEQTQTTKESGEMYILYTASAFDWEVASTHPSYKDMLKELDDCYGIELTDEDDLYDKLGEWDMKFEKVMV